MTCAATHSAGCPQRDKVSSAATPVALDFGQLCLHSSLSVLGRERAAGRNPAARQVSNRPSRRGHSSPPFARSDDLTLREVTMRRFVRWLLAGVVIVAFAVHKMDPLTTSTLLWAVNYFDR